MNVWRILIAIGVMAVVYIIVPVWLAARAYFRSQKLVRCPVVGLEAGVVVGRAGLAQALGRRSLRRIAAADHHRPVMERLRERDLGAMPWTQQMSLSDGLPMLAGGRL